MDLPPNPFADALAPLEWDGVRRLLQARTATLLGAREAERILPSIDPEEVRHELALSVECLALLRRGGRLPLPALRDPEPILARLAVAGVRLEGQEIYDLCLALRAARDLKAALAVAAQEGAEAPGLLALARALPDLEHVLGPIGENIGPNGEVQDSASSELRKLRRRIQHLSEKLQAELQAIIDSSRSDVFLRDEYITVRNGRFVLPVRTDSPIPVPGILHGRSSTGLTHFVEPLATVTINNEIVGLREAEEEEVDRILRAYTALLREASAAVAETVALLARFDLVQARARLGQDLGAVAAEEAPDASLTLEGARHPLLEEALAARGQKAVPIGMQMGGEHPVLIISGPNTGGKTVSLKTVGLLVLMNQAGMLVPAVAARLPIFRRVLVDIGDHQSIAANLSTFSSHMQNIGRMSGQVEPPTLVLLDEIGTGTDPEEGAALGVAILSHFHRLGALVVVTTHMSGIKQYGYATQGVKNACVEFDEATLRPTFRLLLGVAGSSSGIDIARRLGLPEEIVAAAHARMAPQGQEADTYLKRVKETLHEVAAERERVVAELQEAKRERARYEADARRQETERAKQFRQDLAAVVDRYDQALRDTLHGLEDKAIRLKLEKDGKKRGADAAAAIEREARERFQTPNRPAFTPPAEVYPGDRVRIVSLGATGVVESASEGRVRISAGGKGLSVPLADLLLLERARPDTPPTPAAALPKGVSFVGADRGAAALELHLIGRTVDEALPLVDKFLDDAFLAGHLQVRLVPGHGTGTLRRAIADFLKDHPHVANYRFGIDREGGAGVTMVDLRR